MSQSSTWRGLVAVLITMLPGVGCDDSSKRSREAEVEPEICRLTVRHAETGQLKTWVENRWADGVLYADRPETLTTRRWLEGEPGGLLFDQIDWGYVSWSQNFDVLYGLWTHFYTIGPIVGERHEVRRADGATVSHWRLKAETGAASGGRCEKRLLTLETRLEDDQTQHQLNALYQVSGEGDCEAHPSTWTEVIRRSERYGPSEQTGTPVAPAHGPIDYLEIQEGAVSTLGRRDPLTGLMARSTLFREGDDIRVELDGHLSGYRILEGADGQVDTAYEMEITDEHQADLHLDTDADGQIDFIRRLLPQEGLARRGVLLDADTDEPVVVWRFTMAEGGSSITGIEIDGHPEAPADGRPDLVARCESDQIVWLDADQDGLPDVISARGDYVSPLGATGRPMVTDGVLRWVPWAARHSMEPPVWASGVEWGRWCDTRFWFEHLPLIEVQHRADGHPDHIRGVLTFEESRFWLHQMDSRGDGQVDSHCLDRSSGPSQFSRICLFDQDADGAFDLKLEAYRPEARAGEMGWANGWRISRYPSGEVLREVEIRGVTETDEVSGRARLVRLEASDDAYLLWSDDVRWVGVDEDHFNNAHQQSPYRDFHTWQDTPLDGSGSRGDPVILEWSPSCWPGPNVW